jgi:hypothetical protein
VSSANHGVRSSESALASAGPQSKVSSGNSAASKPFTGMCGQDFRLSRDFQTGQRFRLRLGTEVLSSPNHGDLQLCASRLNPGYDSSIMRVPHFGNLTAPHLNRYIHCGLMFDWGSWGLGALSAPINLEEE